MAVLSYTYMFSTTTAEPPTGSQIRFDAGPPYLAVSRVWVKNLTQDGVDAHAALMLADVGFRVYVQDKDEHTRFASFTVTGPAIDKTDYVEWPVEWVENGTALANQQASLYLATPVPGPTPPTPGPPTDPVIDAGPGSPTANSYETVEEFKAYLATKAHTANVPTDDSQLAALLVQGTRIIEASLAGPVDLVRARALGYSVVYAWTGQSTTVEQALAWPMADQRDARGRPIPADVVPQGVKDCLSETAYTLIASDLDANTNTSTSASAPIKGLTAGPVKIDYGERTSSSSAAAGVVLPPTPLPDAALRALYPPWYQTVVPGGGTGDAHVGVVDFEVF